MDVLTAIHKYYTNLCCTQSLQTKFVYNILLNYTKILAPHVSLQQME